MGERRETLIPIMIICFFLVSFSITDIVWADTMSFYEAIDAASLGNHKDLEVSYEITGSSDQSPFVDKKLDIAGILVWLTPNGTCYQVEYPSEKILGKIAQAYSSEYIPPDGYTFWHLLYGAGEEYWIDISDGSIIYYSPPMSDTSSQLPTNIFGLPNFIIYIILPIVLVVVIAIPSVLIIRRKNRIKKRCNEEMHV